MGTGKKAARKRKDYEKLKHTAYEYIVVQGLDQKEVAQKLDVSEQSISKWAKEGRWKEEREARQHCASVDIDNTKRLLSLMAKQRLNLETLIQDAVAGGNAEEEARLRKQASALSDEMSKINKTLISLGGKNYTLGVFIDIMDEIFNSLRVHDEGLWEKTIDFQSQLIRKKTNELG